MSISYSGLVLLCVSLCVSFCAGLDYPPWQIDAQTVQLKIFNDRTSATIQLRLWTPPGISTLRGVIVCGPGSNQQNTDVGLRYAQYERWQVLAQRHAFGLVGVQWTSYPGGNPLSATDPNDDLEVGLAKIGNVSNHAELAVVPVVVWGMSASGGFSMGYADARPERCIAWSDNKGATVGSYDLSGPALSVPGLLTYSEYGLTVCPQYRSHPGTPDWVCSTYVYYRQQGALLTIIPDWSIDHVEWGYGNYFAITYFDQVIEARLPANYQPGTVANLVTLTESSGWLGKLNNFGYTDPYTGTVMGSYCYCTNPTIPAIVKRTAFTGSNKDALNALIYTWLPNEYLARLWQAASIYTHGAAVTSPNQWNSNVGDPAYVFNLNVSVPIVAGAQNGYTITGLTWFDGLTQFDQRTNGTSLSTNLAAPSFGLHPIRVTVNTSSGNQSISGFSLLAVRNCTGPIFVTPATASLSAIVNGAVALSALAVPTDGGVSNNTISYTWSMRSGPGTVTFGSTNGLNAASSVLASVSAPGVYVIDVVAQYATQYYQHCSALSETSVEVLTVAPVLSYIPFDENQGSNAADVSGKGNSASLVNGATWATGVVGNGSCAVFNKAASQYATLPSGIVQPGNYCTIAVWVNPKTSNTWQRVFDFGTGTNNYMFLTTVGGKGVVTFGIRTPSVSEQDIFGTQPLPVGVWSHVAVVLSRSTGLLYVNGTLVGTNSAMTIVPSNLGATTQNWLGRSQWSGDPYLDGSIDDFRWYSVSLSQAAIQALASTPTTALSTLQANLAFDEGSGGVAQDWTGNGWSATLQNAPVWTVGKSGSAVNLTSTSSQYASLPNGVVKGLTACTISVWVNLQSVVSWARVFDFGTGTTNYMFVTPSAGGAPVRFAIRTPSVAEQRINGGSVLPTGGWTHVAVVLNGANGTLYVNGSVVGTNTAMTLSPSSLGKTTQNWIGRSQFSGDPYLNGVVDEFRIYGAALTAAQIATLAA